MDSVPIDENIGLTGSETVGVIIAIVSGATVLIILVLLASMGCRYWFYHHTSSQRRGRGRLLSEAIPQPRNQYVVRTSSTQATGDQKEQFKMTEEAVTTNTFQQLPEPPPVDDSTFTNQQNGDVAATKKASVVEQPDIHSSSQPQTRQFPRDDLMLQEKLGEGEYGPIYRGEAYGLGAGGESQSVTVKMLSPHDTNRDMFDQDIDMLSSISHLNVVGLLAVCTKDSPECLLLDAGMPGDLLSYVREKKKGVATHIATEAETNELLRIADEITLGMAYLASERFIHKDLALRNCIIGLDGVVKIAHFGLGPLVYPEAYCRVSNTDLPIRWMSPEAITSASFTTMSDIWSFGVVVWELFTYGELPFEDKQDNQVIELVLHQGRLRKPTKCSNAVFEVVRSCWSEEPQSRPSFYDLHESMADLGGIQSPLSTLAGPATPVSPLSPLTPTGMFSNDAGVPSTFKTT